MYIATRNHLLMRRLALIAGDGVIMPLAFWVAAMVRLGYTGGTSYFLTHLLAITLTILVFMAAYYLVDLSRTDRDFRKLSVVANAVLAGAGAFVLSAVLYYAHKRFEVGRGVFAIGASFLVLGTLAWRYAYSKLASLAALHCRALVLGSGAVATRAIDLVRDGSHNSLKIFGLVSDNGLVAGDMIHGVPVVAKLDNLESALIGHGADMIIVATDEDHRGNLVRRLLMLRLSGVEMVDYAALHEQLLGRVPVGSISEQWLFSASMRRPNLYAQAGKRLLDVVVAGMLLAAAGPLLALAALLIKLTSKGPVLYKQERLTLKRHPFTILKLRTMVPGAEPADRAQFATRNDPRITRVGRFLRQWRIDEIPQLLNVIKGDMSLVGPRPERNTFSKHFERLLPFYAARLAVRPGLTGWAQIHCPYASSDDQTREKLEHDLYYVKNQSAHLDLLILLKTARTVLAGRGC